jgi:hypothetical protein
MFKLAGDEMFGDLGQPVGIPASPKAFLPVL